MQLKISLLAKIPNEEKVTFYLLHKQPQKTCNIVLPIEVINMATTTLEDTYIRTLNALNAQIKSLNIYLYLEAIYYVYLNIEYNGRHFDINTTIDNALNMLTYQPTIDIYIEKDILDQEGIKITERMLKEGDNLIT